jgi:succinate dehydrogenase / fumarate reductase membrane anchor subunit
MKFSGVKAHVWQRISAVYLLFYIPLLAYLLITATDTLESSSLAGSLSTSLFISTSILAVIALMIHAWIGLRDVIIDYFPDKHVTIALKTYFVLLIILSVNLIWLSLNLI